MEVVQGVQNGYTVLNLEMNKVQQCNSCILNTLHHGIIMMSDNNGIPDNNGKIQDKCFKTIAEQVVKTKILSVVPFPIMVHRMIRQKNNELSSLPCLFDFVLYFCLMKNQPRSTKVNRA